MGRIDHLASLLLLNLENHQVAYGQIIEDVPGLADKVKQLRAKDAQVREEFEPFKRRLEQLTQAATGGHAEGDESLEGEAIRSDILSWVADCRAHDIAVTTWFLEAYYRDDGGSD